MSFYLRIWRLVHTCDANANANANGNTSEFTRSTQTQGKRDTQALWKFFQDGRQWLGFCRFTRVGSERKYKLENVLSYNLMCYTRISSPEESLNNTRKKKNAIFFHVRLISPISCWHVTRLSRHSVRLTKEQQSLHHSQSKVVCRTIFELWLLENWNIRIDAYREWRSNFLRKEKNQNTKWKTESYVFSGFGSGISRGWERKSTSGRFSTGRLWPFTRMISSAGKDQFNTWEFFILKIRPIVFLLWFNACFHLEFANALYDLYSGIFDPLFSFTNRVDFYVYMKNIIIRSCL